VQRMTYTPVETWQLLPDALRKVGLNETDVKGVMGDNMMRVAGIAWQRA
jgi:membrane dipeptidase